MMDNWRDLPITEKQYNTIRLIHENTEHWFIGNTRGDASDFIGAHIEESQANVAEEVRRSNPFGLTYDHEYGFYY